MAQDVEYNNISSSGVSSTTKKSGGNFAIYKIAFELPQYANLNLSVGYLFGESSKSVTGSSTSNVTGTSVYTLGASTRYDYNKALELDAGLVYMIADKSKLQSGTDISEMTVSIAGVYKF